MRESEHFRIERLAEGAFAAIATERGGGYSNAGIVDLGDRTLIFDAFDSVQAGEDLRILAEELTSGPIVYLIISHYHSDHWSGVQAFPSHTSVISTHITRDLMFEEVKELTALKANPSELVKEIEELQLSLENETNPIRRSSLESNISRIHQDLASLPIFQPRLPDQTFDNMLVFHGSQRKAELVTQGKGHTESDAYLILPEERIVFMGDLGFFQCQPFMVNADLLSWEAQLKTFLRSDVEAFVPGHGALGKKSDLTLMLDYFDSMEELVRRLIDEGKAVDYALKQILPPPFDEWQERSSRRYERNVKSLYQKMVDTSNHEQV